MNSLKVNTCASLFRNSCGTFLCMGSIWKVAFRLFYYVKGSIFGLYIHISGPVSIRITFWGVNRMVSDTDFKLVIHFDSSDSWVILWCLSWVTDPITNYGWVAVCKFPILVVTSFTSFHSWLILTSFTILALILDMFIPVYMDSF